VEVALLYSRLQVSHWLESIGDDGHKKNKIKNKNKKKHHCKINTFIRSESKIYFHFFLIA